MVILKIQLVQFVVSVSCWTSAAAVDDINAQANCKKTKKSAMQEIKILSSYSQLKNEQKNYVNAK